MYFVPMGNKSLIPLSLKQRGSERTVFAGTWRLACWEKSVSFCKQVGSDGE